MTTEASLPALEFSVEQISTLMVAIVAGTPGIDGDELIAVTDRLEAKCQQALRDGGIARLILDGELAVRWDDELEDFRLWVRGGA